MIAACMPVPFLPAAPAFGANQITGGCSSSSTGIVLPNYNLVTKVQQTGTGTLAVTCTGTGTVSVQAALDAGGGSCTTRQMANGANVLSYNIYTTSAYATVWCEPTRVSTSFTFNSATIPQTLTNNVTMYVRVPASQSVPTGTYSDTIGTVVYWTGGNSATATFTVTEDAPASCSASVTSLAFGTYTGAAKTGTATVSVTCTSGSAYTIALAAGSNPTGSQRRMKSPAGQFINYALYKDAGFATPWGDGTALGTTTSGSGSGAAQSYTVYGRAPAASVPPPGTYSDSVVVTVTY